MGMTMQRKNNNLAYIPLLKGLTMKMFMGFKGDPIRMWKQIKQMFRKLQMTLLKG